MTVIVAASAAALGFALAVLLAAVARARSSARRLAVLSGVAHDLGAVSHRLAAGMDELEARRAAGSLDDSPALTLADVLERIAADAAETTGAEAVALRVDGPADQPVTALFGPGVDEAVLDATLAATGPGSFRAATIRWSYDPGDAAGHGYCAATVAPVVEDGQVTGALVTYARAEESFGPEVERALRVLVDRATPLVSQARRLALLQDRYLTDAATGARNLRAYETEVEREIGRARLDRLPLSLVVLELRNGALESAPSGEGGTLAALADVIGRAARGHDLLFRRRERQLALLLPGTRGAGADAFGARLRREAGDALPTLDDGGLALAVLEWHPRESFDAFEERVATAFELDHAARSRDGGPPAHART